MASKWTDMVEMVSAQDVDIIDAEGEDMSETFLAAVERIRADAPRANSGKQNGKIHIDMQNIQKRNWYTKM